MPTTLDYSIYDFKHIYKHALSLVNITHISTPDAPILAVQSVDQLLCRIKSSSSCLTLIRQEIHNDILRQ